MKSKPLQYFMHYGPAAFRLELAGDLDSDGARRLERDWRRASSLIGNRTLIVDLTFVTGVEEEGRTLLARWHAAGAQFIAHSKVSRALAEAIAGEPVSEFASAGYASANRTWLPHY